MRGVVGFRGQVSALPSVVAGRGIAPGTLPLLGIPSAKAIPLTAVPSNISATGPNGTLNSVVVAITQKATQRAEAFRQQWQQISGPPGVAVQHPQGVYFQHSSLPNDTTSSIVWRCVVDNNFGLGGQVDVAFTLTTYTPIPPLGGSASPSGATTFVYIDPVTRLGRCNFSAAGSGGVPPYTYDWGGGAFPTSASNYTDVYLPPGATSGIDYNAGCTITDSIGQTKTVAAGPFFVMEA